MTDEVLVDRADAVATVTLNRPEKLNAVTPSMQATYADVLRELDADSSVRAIVVTGAGRGFCSGADISNLSDQSQLLDFIFTVDTMPTVALDLRKPVVAAVNGPVAGIGFAFMLACDVRFLAASARIGTTFARLGLVAEYGLAWLLPRVVGLGHATELLMSGRTIDSAEALRIGLVQDVVPDGEVLARAQGWARDVAANCSPKSLATMKDQLYADPLLDRHAAVQRAIELMRESFTWDDLRVALEARVTKTDVSFPPL